MRRRPKSDKFVGFRVRIPGSTKHRHVTERTLKVVKLPFAVIRY